jgi:Fe-S cluster biogenesis protein NfuA
MDSELISRIEGSIDIIRPAIQADGGDIVFHKFEDGIVYVSLIGACESCAVSSMTIKGGVERILMAYHEEIDGVEQI